jgi:hypothetical protein
MNTQSVEIDDANRHHVRTVANNVPVPDIVQVDSSVSTFAATKSHALIIGEGASIVRVLNIVWPMLRKPVVHCEGRRLILPSGHEGTLVIRDAQQLSEQDQERLLAWWNRSQPQPRIIACASPQVFAQVEAGAFNRCLFDRLRDFQLTLA